MLVRESGWSQTSIYVTGYSDSEGQHQTYNLASVNWSHPEDMLDMTIGLLSSTSYIGCRLYTYISSARMFTVKPMIRPYRVKDNAYVPYTRTNYQLTKDVSEKVSDYASSPSSWDTIPTQSSTKPVTSGGVYSALPSIMTGATTSANGTKGLVPAPLSADRTKFLKGDGTWSDVEHDSLSDLANVTLTTPTDGQVLKYDSTSNKWVNGDGVITNFAGLSDVNLTSLANGQLIQYNASTQKWVNIGIDTTPTQNSTNPVTSGGIYTELGKKQPTYSNDPSFWDTVPTVSSNKPVTSGGIYDSEYDIYDTIGRTGAVNMLPNRAASTVVNGITFTVNDDGSVIVNGTATAFTSVRLADFKDATFYKENIGKVLKLSGSPPGGALSNGHKLRFHYENENFVDDYGDGVVIVPDAEHSETWFVSIAVSDGATVSNLTFKPMITVPSYSGDYVPYVKSNKELMNIVLNSVRRTRRDITNDLENLSTAIERQCLEAYGYTIGDYFTGPSGCTYCLADMDTFYGGYDRYAVVNTHHIAIVVKPLMTGDIYWTTDSNVSGGYANSNLHSYLQTTVLDDIKSDFIALFGGTTGLEHLISHKKMLSTGITASTWFDDQFISALSEVQVNGSRVFGANGYQIGEARTPLQLFKKYNYNELFGPYAYWLRDIESNTRVCTTGDRGNARYEVVSNKLRVLGLILFY